MKILFIDTCHPFLLNALKANGHECVENYTGLYEELIQQIENVEGLIIRSRITIDKNFLLAAKNLKFIARAGAGMESMDMAPACSRPG